MEIKSRVFTGLLLTICCLTILQFASRVDAASKVVEIEGVSYNVSHSMADNLKTFMGIKIYVTIDSGKVITGLVKGVGKHLLHLERLDGKDYFDALIRIDDISAIDTRFREFKR